MHTKTSKKYQNQLTSNKGKSEHSRLHIQTQKLAPTQSVIDLNSSQISVKK